MCWADWTKGQTCCPGTMYLHRNGDYIPKRIEWFGLSSGKQRWTSSQQDNSHCLFCLLCLTASMPILFFQTARCPGPWLAQCSLVCLPLNCPATSGRQVSHEIQTLSLSVGPTLEKPGMVPQIDPAAVSSPLANIIEEGCSLTNEGSDLAPQARVVEASCLALRQKPLQLPVCVTNAIVKASTSRHLYTLKW